MPAKPRKPKRQVQQCPRCRYAAEMSSGSGPCLCPRCLVRRVKWVDMARVK